MSKSRKQISEFTVTAQLKDFVIKDGYKIKYLRILVGEREYWIKVPKSLRESLDTNIVPGVWLEISGYQEKCLKTGKLKLEADVIKLAYLEPKIPVFADVNSKTKTSSSKGTILICQKSDCAKRGAKRVCQLLEQSLHDRGLSEEVQIKLTGCLKECKHGPNLVIMPDRARYGHVSQEKIPALLEQHFPR